MNPLLDKELLDLCLEGNKLAAVKRCREATGWGLKESLDYVEQLEARGFADYTPPSTRPTNLSSLDEELVTLCKNGQKIEAIKHYKEASGLGLKESKDYIEQLEQRYGLVTPSAVGKSGCFIATACYGDYDAPEVLMLRYYRDYTLMPSKAGRLFVKVYYTLSPPLARLLNQSERLKNSVRRYILAPIINRLK